MNASITIRNALTADLDWISDQYRALDFLASDITETPIAIAEYAGDRVGLGRLTDLGGVAYELGGLWIAHAFRKENTAALLIDYLMKQARGKKIYVLAFNGPLIDFFKDLGFKERDQGEKPLPTKLVEKVEFCRSQYEQGVAILYFPEQAGLAFSEAKQALSKL